MEENNQHLNRTKEPTGRDVKRRQREVKRLKLDKINEQSHAHAQSVGEGHTERAEVVSLMG